MAAKEIAVKKYVVRLTDEERERLNGLISKGKHPARQLLKARILLKADASGAGEAWSDSQIAAALETSVDTVARARQRLVEEGVERRPDLQAFAKLGQKAHLRWRSRSETDRAGLFDAPSGAREVDVAASGRDCRRAEHC